VKTQIAIALSKVGIVEWELCMLFTQGPNVKVSTSGNCNLHLVKFEYLLLGEGECFTHGNVERQNHLSKRVQLNR
jgi:hypothetical protein